jgi:hypothetical protein
MPDDNTVLIKAGLEITADQQSAGNCF